MHKPIKLIVAAALLFTVASAPAPARAADLMELSTQQKKVGSLKVTVTWTKPDKYTISVINSSRSDLPAKGKISTLNGRSTVADCDWSVEKIAGGGTGSTEISCGDATVTSYSFTVAK
jgi:hypothetical protein